MILVENNELVGFISIFPEDCEEERTTSLVCYNVCEKYRNHGYSRILNDAILKEAKYRGFLTLYLKQDLKNYYEKFGAVFIKKLKIRRSLYKFEI